MDMLDGFIDYLKVEKRYSTLTVNSYRRDVGRFLEHLAKTGTGEAIDPRLITPDDIRSWIASLMREGDLKSSSVNKMVCSVRAWFRYLLRTKAIQRDPFLKISFLKTGARLPVYVPQNKMLAVVDHLEQEVVDGAGEADGTASACAAEASGGTVGERLRSTGRRPGREERSPNRPKPAESTERLSHLRNEAIILLLYSTGIRLAELVNIKIGDLSDGLERLKVLGKGDKERVVPLVEPVREKLAEYMEAVKTENICTTGEKALFLTDKGRPLGRSEVYKLVHDKLGEAGVTGKRSPHILRHTFATHMLDNGAGMREIQELLGHSSLGTTQIYTHNSIARLKEVYSTAHPRGGGKNKL